MKLLLIRHAESRGNAEGRLQGQSDWPLSDRGLDQARALARRLAREERATSAVYASDLSRALQTAEIIATALGLAVTVDERLREYNFGVLDGIVWREVEHRYPEIWRGFYEERRWLPVPGEEGAEPFRTRLAAAVDDILARHADTDAVAVVTHGGSLGTLTAHLLGMPIRRPQPFHFRNASLSAVDFGRWGPLLVLQNDTCHLDGCG